MPQEIFLLDDDPAALRLASDLLKNEGYVVRSSSDPNAVLAAARKDPPALLLLDVRMPRMDGFSVLKSMKMDPELRTIPVIMVSGCDQEADIVAGIEIGAEDYILKPYQQRELVARVRAALRRPRVEPERRVIESGPIRVDERRHEASLEGNKITLRPKEYQLLVFFLKHEGQALTRSTISENVWKIEHIPGAKRINFYVEELRKKLGHYGGWIQALPGVGYRFEPEDGSFSEPTK